MDSRVTPRQATDGDGSAVVVASDAASGNSARAHRALAFFRNRWRVRRGEDARPYFEASILFQAKDMEEADRLFDQMVDGLECGDGVCDAVRPCPYFRVGGLHQLDEDES